MNDDSHSIVPGQVPKMPLDDAYELFKQDLPDVTKHMHRNLFQTLRPFWVIPASDNTCLCVYHSRMRLFLEAYRDFTKEVHADCSCECDFCRDGDCVEHICESNESLRSHVLCPKPAGSDSHKLECVTNNCSECRNWKRAKVLHCQCENSTTAKVKYKDYDQETHKYTKEEDGESIEKEKTRTVLRQKEASAAEFMDLFRKVSVDFFEHSHVAWWNGTQFDLLLQSLPEGHIAIVEDFQMNYTHSHNNAIQGEHWDQWQTTLFPAVVYRRIKDEATGELKTVAEAHVFMSPDRKHDNCFVQHANEKMISHYKAEMGDDLKGIHIWSDGCKAQFKLKKQYYWLTEAEARYNLKIEHCFFQSCHGKGQSDSLGALVKSALRRAERNGHYMADTLAAFEWMVKNRAEVRRRRRSTNSIHVQLKRFLYYVGLSDIDRRSKVKYKGGEGECAPNFSFIGAGQQGQLYIRWLPCSCSACVKFDAQNCERKSQAPVMSRSDWANRLAKVAEGAATGGGGGGSDEPSETKTIEDETGPRAWTDLRPSVAPDTRASDRNVLERAEKLGRKVKANSDVFVYFDEPELSQCLGVARAMSAPRDIASGGEIVCAQHVDKRSNAKVVDVVFYSPVTKPAPGGASGETFVTYELPPPNAARCPKRKDGSDPGCRCDLWHEETVFLAALRPPINFKMDRLTQNKPALTPGARKRKVVPRPDERQCFSAPDSQFQKALETVVLDRQLLAAPNLRAAAARSEPAIRPPTASIDARDVPTSTIDGDDDDLADADDDSAIGDVAASGVLGDDGVASEQMDVDTADAPSQVSETALLDGELGERGATGDSSPPLDDITEMALGHGDSADDDDPDELLPLSWFALDGGVSDCEIVATPMRHQLTQAQLNLVHSARNARRRDRDRVVVDCKEANIEITGEQMWRMRVNEWLVDEQVNLYMHLLNKYSAGSKRYFCFNSFFMGKLTDNHSGYSYSLVERWTRKIDLFSFERILIPYNIDNSHWALFDITNASGARHVRCLDSFGTAHGTAVGFLCRYMADEHERRHGAPPTEPWKSKEPTDDEPRQTGNGTECGVFVCAAARHLAIGAPLDYGLAEMARFRERLTLELAELRVM